MMSYDTQREYFTKIVKMYMDYVELYRFLNHGSTKGITPFGNFYLVHVFHFRYSSLANKMSR